MASVSDAAMGTINWINGSEIQHQSAVVESVDDLCSLKNMGLPSNWQSLDSHLSPPRQYTWFLSCIEASDRDINLKTGVVKARGGPLAVASMECSSWPTKRQYLLGALELREPVDFVYRDDNALHAIYGWLFHQKVPITLYRVMKDAASIADLRACFDKSALVVTRSLSGCPYLDLDDGVRHTKNLGLSSHLLCDLRRARRKAEEIGAVELEILTPRSEEEFLPLYEKILVVEPAGWKGRKGSAIRQLKWQRNFFWCYGKRASQAGMVRVAFLRINREVVAVQLALVCQQRYWLLKIGYDESYAACSPGMLLLFESLRYAANHDLVGVEFMGGAEQWTQRWTQQVHPTVRIDIYPVGIRGLLALIWDFMSWLVGKPAQLWAKYYVHKTSEVTGRRF